MGVDILYAGTSTTQPTPGAGETQRVSLNTNSGYTWHKMGTEAGSGTVTMNWTTYGADDAIAAIPIKAAATISSAANQSFTVGQATTTASVVTVTEASSVTITAANDIRIRIPATFNMTWDPTVTTVTLGGTASGKVSTTLLAYEDSNKTVVLNVTSNFTAGQTLTITGLKFTNFTAVSAADNLELVTAGTGGATAATDDKTITIAAGATISSAANQSFTVGQATTTASVVTVTEASSVTITAANDIRIRIPATFNMTWDPTVTTVTLGGTASGKVSTTLLAYEDSNKTVVLNVTSNFTAGQTLTITGLKFANFTAVSAADNLELVTAGTGGATAGTDNRTITIAAGATISSAANQSFTVGQATTTASVVTVTEASSVTITAANDIRIRIPATFNMTWDPTVTTVTLGGTASGKVSTTLLAYEDSNKTVVLNVTSNFTAGQTLTITGLKFTNFTAVSAADNLELVTAGTGGATAGTDNRTITITAAVLNNFLVEAAGGGNIGSQTAGTPFNIKITARDASNNILTSFTGTVDITSTGTLSAGGGTTAAFTAGVLASTSVTISNAGTFTITATRTAGTETGTSNAFMVCGSVADASYVAANAQAGQAIVYWASSNPALILQKGPRPLPTPQPAAPPTASATPSALPRWSTTGRWPRPASPRPASRTGPPITTRSLRSPPPATRPAFR